MAREFVVIRDTKRAKRGLIVYECPYDSFGLTNEDTRTFGEEYGAYSFNEDGSLPFITIPKSAVKEV
jgi:NAD-dependent dihydropyrimidine dehydrogenase PreA subunit